MTAPRPGKAAYRDRGPEGKAGQRGDQDRPEADLQRERHDLDEVGVERDEQPECFAERGAEILHGTNPFLARQRRFALHWRFRSSAIAGQPRSGRVLARIMDLVPECSVNIAFFL